MESAYLNNLAISVEKQGSDHATNSSFLLRYGKYSEIKTSEYEFLFNLNGEIKFIRGLDSSWPHPAEQLKRTDGNDWVYYSVGDDSSENGIISWLGEYYLPCLPYPSNSIWEINYLSNPAIMNAFAAWARTYGNIYESTRYGLHRKAKNLLKLIVENHDGALYERAQEMKEIIGAKVSVLPPDTRHIDYEIIPLMITDGCLHHCKFCCVKSAQTFQPRSKNNILEQIANLKDYYGRNLENYNGLFLGNHDALSAGEDLILYSASEAYSNFEFGKSERMTPLLFLFASANSLLKSEDRLFERLNQLPFYTYINIGLESNDAPTLTHIGKPLSESNVHDAFQKMLDVNDAYESIEITANFVVGKGLSGAHYESLMTLLQTASTACRNKGCIYLSPLKGSPKKRELLPMVKEIKGQSRLPVYVFLIQRL
jgi:hypothetical protein